MLPFFKSRERGYSVMQVRLVTLLQIDKIERKREDGGSMSGVLLAQAYEIPLCLGGLWLVLDTYL
jgi:hypothetical protein